MEKDPPNRDDDSTSDILVNERPDGSAGKLLACSLIPTGSFVASKTYYLSQLP